VLSQLAVEPVTEDRARRAATLLVGAGLHGHRHAIDAMLCATALAGAAPITILTSDPADLATLCGRRATLVKI
jgi:hypothetical protein